MPPISCSTWRIGRAWREAAEEAADRETVIRNLLAGEYNDPVRIVAFDDLSWGDINNRVVSINQCSKHKVWSKADSRIVRATLTCCQASV